MNASDIARYLGEHEFFAGLDKATLEFLAANGERRHLEEDDVLFRYHEPAEYFFIVDSGCITLEVAALEGPPLKLQDVDGGALLGWSWLIPPYKWSFQARAVKPTELFAFDGAKIRERCEQDPALGYELFKRFSRLMSERLEFARQKMIDEWRPEGFA